MKIILKANRLDPFILLVLGVLLAACTPTNQPAADPTPAVTGDSEVVETPMIQLTPTSESAGPIQTTCPESISMAAPPILDPQVSQLVQGNSDFAADFYRTVAAVQNQNFIFSPYSASLVFSAIYAGARSETEAQLAQVFRYQPQDSQHEAFHALAQQLEALSQHTTAGEVCASPFELALENSAWAQQNFPFNETYLNTLQQQYGMGLQALDFVSEPDKAREAINAWIAEQTRDRIQNVVPEDAISPETRLVLVNAVYFKGSWELPFSELATKPGTFTLRDGSTVEVPFMHREARILYNETQDYQAVHLNYVGQAAEMLIVLPSTGRFEAVEAQLSSSFFENLRDQSQMRDVTLSLPRFAFETDLNLKELFKMQGLTSPFSPQADLSGMVDGGGLYVSDALQRSMITVDEYGTEATAATVAAMAESALEHVEVHVNRPFIFAILDRATGTLLFLGRVLDTR